MAGEQMVAATVTDGDVRRPGPARAGRRARAAGGRGGTARRGGGEGLTRKGKRSLDSETSGGREEKSMNFYKDGGWGGGGAVRI